MTARCARSRQAALRAVLLASTLAGCSLVQSTAEAGPLQDDLTARRGRVMEKLGPQAMAIFWSAPTRAYSHDVDYEYRQDSDLLYLTGVTQDETILVLVPGSAQQAFLFVHEPNPTRERILGHVMTKDEVRAQSGIETVYFVREFEPFVTALFNQRAYRGRTAFGAASNLTPPGFEAFFDAVRRNTAVLALPLGLKPTPSEPLSTAYEFAAKARDRLLNVTFTDVSRIVAELRHVKTSYERAVMTRSAEISSEAHLAGMRAAKPGRFEYQVEAAIEHVYLDNGAMSWGYPSVVASGPNATTLHYTASSRQMQRGDLLLVDAAANYQGYTADITRTYPVDGTFTPVQKDIYRIVFDAQSAALGAATAGRTIRDIDNAANAVLKAGLLRLGLITDPSGDQFRIWTLHYCCHWIGMDVHDAGDYERRLEPGMTFTVEPGIYIHPDALTQLPDTAENRAFIEKVRPAVEKYQRIGVRIEDSVLLTESGLQNLSRTVPRTIEDIERLMRSAGPATQPR